MERTVVFVLAGLMMVACSKSADTTNAEITARLAGKWQLSAIFLQTNGPGSWHEEDSIPPNFIQFNLDGSLNTSVYVAYLYNSPSGFTITSPSEMVFSYPDTSYHINGENTMHYQLTDSVLTITPPSIEFVEEKYIRVHSNP